MVQRKNEMSAGCSVCSDDQGSRDNRLVYCDGCNVAVHQACYGIRNIPDGDWYCGRCEARESASACELCPSKVGSFKRTESGKWAHVVCALYIPEVRFGNVETMEPIVTHLVPPERYTKTCFLCNEKGANSSTPGSSSTTTTTTTSSSAHGVVIDCSRVGCKQSFHVTCAQEAGLLCEEKSRGAKDDSVVYCGYCRHHFRKPKTASSNRKLATSKNSTNVNSSFVDSASDSSQDNYSKTTNATEQNDKTNTTMTTSATTTTNSNTTTSATATTSTSSASINSSTITATSASSVANPLSTTTSSKQVMSGSSLDINTSAASNSHSPTPPRSSSSSTPLKTGTEFDGQTPSPAPPLNTSGNSNKTSSPSSASSTPQKRKRAPKGSNSASNASGSPASTTLLANAPSVPELLQTSSSSTSNPISAPANPLTNKDVYNWSASNTESSSSSSNAGVSKTTSSTNKNKPAEALSIFNVIGSSNLSISTSSPSPSSNLAKSNSSSSSTTNTTTSSSSVSTSTNSPSPALPSPSLTNRSGHSSTSPLATNSKTGQVALSVPGVSQQTPINESSTSNDPLPLGQISSQARATLDGNSRPDPKKAPLSSASLLSTVVPMTQEPADVINIGLPQLSSTTTIQVPNFATPGSNTLTNNSQSNASQLADKQADASLVAQPLTSNSQPTVPPLVIPVAQMTKSNSKPKATAKSTRKKSTETPTEAPKNEPKAKASRSRKAATPASNATSTTISATNGSTSAEPEGPKGRGKGKSAATKLAAVPSAVTTTTGLPSDLAAVITQGAPTATPSKRKSRSASNGSNPPVAPPPSAKRPRKKKTDTKQTIEPLPNMSNIPSTGVPSTSHLPYLPQAPGMAPGTVPLMINTPNMHGRLPPNFNPLDSHELNARHFSPNISPYTSIDPHSAPSLSRSSLSRLYPSTSAEHHPTSHSSAVEDIGKAFEELRDNTWSHLSKCILDQAQQFDIPSLIGTLHVLKSENEKLVSKVKDLTIKRDQLLTMNARLDMPGPLLTQHLNNTSPNFSSVVASLTNSPKNIPTMASPGSAMGKQIPLGTAGPYGNHVAAGPMGLPGFLDRSSPLVGQAHSGVSNLKSSTISTPSPPISALMAHGTSNRAGLIAVNQPYMPNMYASINSMTPLGPPSSQSSSFYHRQ